MRRDLTHQVTAAAVSATAVATASLVAYYGYWQGQERSRILAGSQMIETASGPVEYVALGPVVAPPVLILHGSPGGYDQAELFARRNGLDSVARVLAPSRPGYLRTPLGECVDAATEADVLADFLTAYGVERVVVLGISGGGPAALEFAARHRDRCDGLILLAAISRPETEAQIYARMPVLQRIATQIADRTVQTNVGPFVLTHVLRGERNQDLRDGLERVTRWDLRREGYRRDMRQIESDHLDVAALSGLRTLIVHGTRDVDVPLSQAQETAELLPWAQVELVEGADHLSIWGRAEAADAVKAFLTRR
ncbi:alpha/beta fold hydrolase [Rudaeicoccus suwonensis]|uniref:Pimeloyl-ACP methyl ester carboxylesterase n=1 Tax=Rudaeicoccus suwonensis TaxID=657409 RepID=A0A561E6Z8_9MICO|nr:alpha/beta hydrolase [Rudaeicoccus suwonensis]TWE11381.1 pimeloyl-ACP methyl ester carboxylesterase [Rudaeicoccus suwonensis]